DLLQFAHRLDLRRERRLQRVVRDGFGAAFVDSLFDDLAQNGLAELFLEKGHRRFARAETLEMHLRLHLFETRGDLLVEVAHGHHDLVLAAQAFGDGLGNLHVQRPYLFQSCSGPPWPFWLRRTSLRSRWLAKPTLPRSGSEGWCGRRDLNPHDSRHWNLNPARLPVPPRPP